MFNQNLYKDLWEVPYETDELRADNFDYGDPMDYDQESEVDPMNSTLNRKRHPDLGEWFESLTDKAVYNRSQRKQKVIKTDKRGNSEDKTHNDEIFIYPLSGTAMKKNGTVYEDHDENNFEMQNTKEIINKSANEEKELRNYYLTQMEDLSNCYMVNLTSESISPKYLAHHFGDAYKEGMCLPRKFFISLEGRNNNRKESCRVLFEVVGMANALESMEDSNYVSIQKLRYLV